MLLETGDKLTRVCLFNHPTLLRPRLSVARNIEIVSSGPVQVVLDTGIRLKRQEFKTLMDGIADNSKVYYCSCSEEDFEEALRVIKEHVEKELDKRVAVANTVLDDAKKLVLSDFDLPITYTGE